jgi:shikimate kinase
MGAGKSSVGRALGERLGWAFEDLDERIQRREGRGVHEIFRDSGESSFRRAEHAALKELLSELHSGAERIVALGGGAFARPRNARLIHAGLIEAGDVPTVFLDAGVKELWRRCRQQAEQQGIERPLLGSLESFRKLHEARRPHYMKASFRQETTGKTIERIAAEVVRALGLDRDLNRDLDRDNPERGEKQ